MNDLSWPKIQVGFSLNTLRDIVEGVVILKVSWTHSQENLLF